jgi:hypothetical protein
MRAPAAGPLPFGQIPVIPELVGVPELLGLPLSSPLLLLGHEPVVGA